MLATVLKVPEGPLHASIARAPGVLLFEPKPIQSLLYESCMVPRAISFNTVRQHTIL